MNSLVVDLLRSNSAHATEFAARFSELQDAQHPEVVTVSCADSRVLQDLLWGNYEPGRIFTCGNIGNRVIQRAGEETVVSGDVLYPLVHTGTDVVIIVGHTGCGAVTAAYDHLTDGIDEPAGIEHCLDLLAPALKPAIEDLPGDLDRAQTINRLVEYNVDRQIERLLDSEDVPDSVTCLGVVYDFQDIYSDRRGEVHVINVNGETDPERLRERNPEIESRVDRLWEY